MRTVTSVVHTSSSIVSPAAIAEDDLFTRRISGAQVARQQLAEAAARTSANDLPMYVGQDVEYFSTRNGNKWVQAKVEHLHPDGSIDLNVKKRASANRIRGSNNM